jgi:hypothetical protein
LGDDKPPAVRLAGVHALAGLADDWKDNRQPCIDVLCGYLRMPYGHEPADRARLAFRADREVRHTVIRVIAAHLRDDAAVSWQGLNTAAHMTTRGQRYAPACPNWLPREFRK